LLSVFDQFGSHPKTVLDIACGTGSVSHELAKRGVDVIGLDISEEMLSKAAEKTLGQNVMLLCQDMCEIDLYGTVEGAVCVLDSINHITDHRKLLKFFRRLSLFIEPGGILIFDVNTPYKHESILGDNIFVLDRDDLYLVWTNRFHKRTSIVDITLDFFVKKGEVYERFSEEIKERAYSFDEISMIIKQSGFSLLGCFDDLSFHKPKKNSERIVFAVRKI
ncbi:MAG: hypothetical protein BGN88_13410, partial [Clostridiales bacterium 43-6]